MELVIAEKPSVARDLARVLGVRGTRDAWWESDRYAITWCIGHLVELEEPSAYDPGWKPWRLDRLPMVPRAFLLRPADHAKKQLRIVEKLLRDRRFSAVINACDAGREGELIFRYTYQHAGSRLSVRRLWISSLTDEAIRRGFASLRPGRDYDALADAARSRSEADWLVGMNATRAITVRARASGGDTLLSIGRVQTPTLALLVARENEIRTFVPTPYWEVRGDFRTADGATFQALWRTSRVSRLATAELAQQVVARDAEHGTDHDPVGPRVVALRARTVSEPAPQLFDLTSLQRTANRRFGFSAQRTLELAQALYERHKVITYPRTDSRYLSTDLAKELAPLFAALATHDGDAARFAQQLAAYPPRPTPRIVDDRKIHDHHAIIPTGTAPRGTLDRDEARIYDLILRRFLGAFFPDAELAVTEAWIRVGAGDVPPPELGPGDRETIAKDVQPPPDHYFARGRVRTVAGWQTVAGIDATAAIRETADRSRGIRDEGRDDDAAAALPALVMGQRLAGTFKPITHETKPPPRYSEATLLAAMEGAGKTLDDEALRAAMKDVGLGTPATRAAIIETLLRRRYIARERGQLVATPTGIGLIATIPVPSLVSAELTGHWEARLARIARGEDTRRVFMADIERYVRDLTDKIRGSSALTVAGEPQPELSSRDTLGARKTAPSKSKVARKVRENMALPLGSLRCPRCMQGHLITGARGWGCDRWQQGCSFVVWFETAGKRLSVAQLRALVTKGKTPKATFVDGSGKPIEARLMLDVSIAGGAYLVPV